MIGAEDVVAIMIPEPKGKEIVSLLERNVTVMMYITIGTRNLQKYVSRTSVVFVSISFIVLMIISLAWLVFYYIQRFRYANARDRNQVSSSEGELCFVFCSICLEGVSMLFWMTLLKPGSDVGVYFKSPRHPVSFPISDHLTPGQRYTSVTL